MSIQTLYPKLSKWSFFAFLFICGATILMYNMLPSHESATSRANQCYWTNAMIVYIECGENVPMKEMVEFILNKFFALAIIPLVPFYILFFPPILWAFVISFYFLVASCPISTISRRFWGEPAPEKTARFYKLIKSIFIFLLTIFIILQVYKSYDKYLVNTIYWQTKLGIVPDKFENSEDYSKALWTATNRDEIGIVKLLFSDNYDKQGQLLETAVHKRNYELVDFFLTRGVEVTPQVLKTSFNGITGRRVCEKTDDSNYRILRRLLTVKSPENELLRISAISLCYPLMEILLKSGGNPDYITLLDLAKKTQVTPSNGSNGWLYGRTQEEIEKHRTNMIDLISKYQKNNK